MITHTHPPHSAVLHERHELEDFYLCLTTIYRIFSIFFSLFPFPIKASFKWIPSRIYHLLWLGPFQLLCLLLQSWPLDHCFDHTMTAKPIQTRQRLNTAAFHPYSNNAIAGHGRWVQFFQLHSYSKHTGRNEGVYIMQKGWLNYGHKYGWTLLFLQERFRLHKIPLIIRI